jgi:hypothetical protein
VLQHQEINEENKQIYIKNKKALKGVSKAVFKNCIDHQDFIDTKLNNVPLKRDVIGFRSFGHQVYTVKMKRKH